DAVSRIGAYDWPVRLIPTVRAAIEAIGALDPGPGLPGLPGLPDGAGLPGGSAPGLPGGSAPGLPGGDPGALAPGELLGALGPAAALVAGTIRNSANPTTLRAGEVINVIPGEAVGYLDGRVLPGYEA